MTSSQLLRIVDYGPYHLNGERPGSPVPTTQIAQDLSTIATIGNTVRIYTTNDNLSYVVDNAANYGLQVIPSVYLDNPNSDGAADPRPLFTTIIAQDPSIKAELDGLINLLNSLTPAQLANIPFVVIGNEEISQVGGWYDGSILDAIDYVKAGLNPGIQLKFTTAESAGGQYYLSDNPAAPTDHHTTLGSGVDVIYANILPYWEGIPIDQAVNQVVTEYQELVNTYPGKEIVISETGWPSGGSPSPQNPAAVPSLANEQAFWQQFLVAAAQDNIPYGAFEAFDEPWKSTSIPGNTVDDSWGLYSSSGMPKTSVTTLNTTPVTITSNGVTSLVQIDGAYELEALSSGTGPLVSYGGVLVTAGGAWTPVGAEQTAGGGYEVAWKNTVTNQYLIWNADANGDYTSSATGVLSETSYALENLELTFGEDLNGDGTIGPTTTTIVSNSATILAQVADQYELEDSSGGELGPWLEYQGSVVTSGGAWTPVGAKQTGTGYEVAWYNSGSKVYLIWNADANGDYTSSATGALSGTRSLQELEGLEANFGENFGVGTPATPTPIISSINTAGVTTLAQVGNLFELYPPASTGEISGPLLEYQGSVVTSGGAWTPVGAVQTASGGYEVAWENTVTNRYLIWNADANGDYTSSATGILSGTSPTIEAVEANFGEDFAGSPEPTPIPITSSINTADVTTLAQVGNLYELYPPTSPEGISGPLLEYQGSVLTSGGAWTPVGAKQTGTGYEVAWYNSGSKVYLIWNADANGDYTSSATGALSGTRSLQELEGLEANFGENFGVGTPATPTPIISSINTAGVTTLAQVGNLFELYPPASTGEISGPLLEYQGSVVTSGGAWTPVGAQETGNGYEVAWENTVTNQYLIWNADANGDYTSSATGVLSGTSPTIEAVEANFGEQFPGAGPPATTTRIASNGTTTLAQVGNLFELNPASGTGTLLEYQGSVVTSGGAWTPVGAEKTRNGYEVAWNLLGSDQYLVWNADSNGDYTNSATGVVSGQSFALEDLEPAFGEEVNGDGRTPSQVLITSTGPGDILNLALQTQSATINLGANSASADAGLNAPSLGFTGTPDAITLGSDADIVEYALEPSSGIETISNFTLGTDELNIDLMGAADAAFEIYNTMVGGQNAIAIASSADPDHGVVLLNMPTSDTAAALSASHVTFAGGHALIS